MKNYNFLLTIKLLTVLFISNAMVAQISFGVDINSSDNPAGPDGDSPASDAPYVSMFIERNGPNIPPATTASVGSVNFTLSASQNILGRNRNGVTLEPANVLRDFAFTLLNGSTTITMDISGLTDGQLYTLYSYHYEGDTRFPARMSVELQENGTAIAGGAQIIDNDPRVTTGVDSQTTTAFVFTAVAGATYSIVSSGVQNTLVDPTGGLPAPPKQRNRFNGVLITEGNILNVNDFTGELTAAEFSVTNPFSDFLNISMDTDLSFTDLKLYNSIGQVVKTISKESIVDQIPFSGPKGMYFLTVNNGNETLGTVKLIKE